MNQIPAIVFEDGAGYERMMGTWSRIAGNAFLDWLQPRPGLRWVDVGCGNGAFTQLVVDRCAPASVDAFDPAQAQIDYALQRPAARTARFRLGDAMAAPFPDASFDVAVMALVLFFVPEPGRGLAEMIRMLAPGGMACAYTWDILGGGFPLAPLGRAMKEMDMPAPLPPSVDISREEATRQLWLDAGLQDVQTHAITVQRRFEGFDDLWGASQLSASIAARLRTLPSAQIDELKRRYRDHLQQDTSGPITCTARAIAVKGVVGR